MWKPCSLTKFERLVSNAVKHGGRDDLVVGVSPRGTDDAFELPRSVLEVAVEHEVAS